MAPGRRYYRGRAMDITVICTEEAGKIVEYITTRPIFEMCNGVENMQEASLCLR